MANPFAKWAMTTTTNKAAKSLAAPAAAAAAGERAGSPQPARQAGPAPPSLATTNSQQVQTTAPAAPQTSPSPPASSSSRRTRSSSNTTAKLTTTPPPKKKRKAYAALTGPARGLGPKLGSGAPLRLILVGHNPSEYAHHVGHFYGNPSNRMFPILISTGIAPPGATGPEADDSMPGEVGVGFVDVGSGEPGTDSSLFSSEDFQRWRSGFYERLRQHVKQASDSIGCTCGMCGAPSLIAFAGKRQYLELLNIDGAGQLRRGKNKIASSTVQLGRQPAEMLPPGWPLPVDRTEVWVCTSTSGAAPMSNEDRERPYRQLAGRLKQIPWPRPVVLQCDGGGTR